MMKMIKQVLGLLAILLTGWLMSASVVMAKEGQVLGVHIMNTGELSDAAKLIKADNQEEWHYVTIPITLSDLEKKDQWQSFFDQARQQKIIPLVRLATAPENGNWKIPNKGEIIQLIDFLADLNWPTDKKYVIMFNEVNHAQEWGGKLDPAGYANLFVFAAKWAKTEQKNFVVLPAAMDLAANNSDRTREAFAYLEAMYEAEPTVFDQVDVWNSHSYPNPGFVGSPEATAKNSLRGFLHELDFLKKKTGRDYQVMITETGWISNNVTNQWLESYYTYALQHIWNNPQVLAVTPFVLRGSPGPFAEFSFLDANGNPTIQYFAFQHASKKVAEQG